MSMCDPVPLVIPEGQEPFVLYVVSILIKEERYDSTWGWGWSGGPSDYALWTTSFVGPFTLDEVVAAEMGDKKLRQDQPALTSTDPRIRFRSVLHTVYPVGISIKPDDTEETEEPTGDESDGKSDDHI